MERLQPLEKFTFLIQAEFLELWKQPTATENMTKNVYTFHDTSYDQDDYDYQAMDEMMLNKHIKKYVKNATKVNWLVK